MPSVQMWTSVNWVCTIVTHKLSVLTRTDLTPVAAGKDSWAMESVIVFKPVTKRACTGTVPEVQSTNASVTLAGRESIAVKTVRVTIIQRVPRVWASATNV